MSQASTSALPRQAAGARVRATSLTVSNRAWRDCRSDAAQARWAVLAERATEPNPFFEPWYLLPSLGALDPDGEITLLVVEQQGEWLGLLPLGFARRYYGYPVPQWRGWLHANAFLGAPLIVRGREAEVWSAMLDWIDGRAGAGLFFHLPALPVQSSLFGGLRRACDAQGRQLALVHSEERALLASDLPPDAYLEAALSGKKRKELRRQFARLSELGPVAVERQRDTAGLQAWIADFLAVEKAGWKGRAGSALACAAATAGLFTAALTAAAELGRLERLTLTLSGRPIAMLATFIAGEGAFSYKTAFDENYARFSPGVLLQRENLSLLDDPGLAWCDSCAAADHPMIDHLWRERRTIGHASVAIGGTLRRAAFRLFVSAEQSRARSRIDPVAAPGAPE